MGTVLLVRHGQASFGAADYDVLSDAGHAQARQVGEWFARQGFVPARIVAGTMRRQQDTATGIVTAAGWDVPVTTDPGWNEFDHAHLARLYTARTEVLDSYRYQEALESAIGTWMVEPDPADPETFTEFRTRTEAALEAVTGALARGEDALVVSSGGVISWLAATLLDAGQEQWMRLNRVCVNGGWTRLVVGRRGVSLVSFNEYGHLDPQTVTYR